jgi:hypothetical protein
MLCSVPCTREKIIKRYKRCNKTWNNLFSILFLNFWFPNKELKLAKENSEACMGWMMHAHHFLYWFSILTTLDTSNTGEFNKKEKTCFRFMSIAAFRKETCSKDAHALYILFPKYITFSKTISCLNTYIIYLQRLCLLKFRFKKIQHSCVRKKIKRYCPSIDGMRMKVCGTWSMMFQVSFESEALEHASRYLIWSWITQQQKNYGTDRWFSSPSSTVSCCHSYSPNLHKVDLNGGTKQQIETNLYRSSLEAPLYNEAKSLPLGLVPN